MLEKNCEEFLALLASEAPVPGGGGACAYTGAISVALGSMVGNLTLDKPKYADVQDDMKTLLDKSQVLMNRMSHLVEKDADVFLPLSKAYKLPTTTEQERKAKEEVLQKALLTAASVPLEIASCCLDALRILQEFANKGNRMVVSDAGTGAALCKGALQGARLNVLVNLKLMKDAEAKELISHRLDHILHEGLDLADQIYAQVENAIK